ncbi:MAG: antibiotic biosynthesis monooxygenase [Thermoplasmata archaeon]|nr:antibiotic biosynthesis monooxygenase [Thermoplasmata archaeon]
MSWIAINRISVDTPADADRLVEVFRHRAGKVDLQPGFLKFELWREENGKEVVVLTHWTRREDFLAWVDSPAFKDAHRHAGDAPGQGAGSLYEVAI